MKALVLSSGAVKGAYNVGALQFLLGELSIDYSIFTGVSVGAINCAFLSQFKKGEEKQSIEELSKFWNNLNTKDIYVNHKPFGVLQALWETSLFDSQPLIDLIYKNIDIEKIKSSNKKISVGAVSLSSGKYTSFNHSHDNFIDAVIGSASFPGIFKPIKINDHLYVDGCVKEITPIKMAIDMGATECDVIITSPTTRIKKFIENPNIADVIIRCFDLASDKIMANDIEKALIYNKLANTGDIDKRNIKINIIRPKNNLTEDLLDFNPKKIQEMIKIGYEDAKEQYKI